MVYWDFQQRKRWASTAFELAQCIALRSGINVQDSPTGEPTEAVLLKCVGRAIIQSGGAELVGFSAIMMSSPIVRMTAASVLVGDFEASLRVLQAQLEQQMNLLRGEIQAKQEDGAAGPPSSMTNLNPESAARPPSAPPQPQQPPTRVGPDGIPIAG